MNDSASIPRSVVLAVALFIFTQTLWSQEATNVSVPVYTISPNGRYGVTIPRFDDKMKELSKDSNNLMDLMSSRVLTKIRQRVPAYDRTLNHHDMAAPLWSSDSSLLLWRVRGKWFHDSYVLLRLKDGGVSWQMDVLKTAQDEIRRRTRKASPALYDEVKTSSSGSRYVYPDGFVIDVATTEPLTLPVRVRTFLSSNPKGSPGVPNLGSRMEAKIDSNGRFQVTSFELGEGSDPYF